ncbi:MAG: RMD1 family protein [Calditerrivibrio sp.]|nr:RMD1 family protein [Calditerrivibrio sp.]
MAGRKSIKVYCTAKEFDRNKLFTYLNSRYKSFVIKDAVIVELLDHSTVIVFSYGVTVFWGVDFDTQKSLLDEIAEFEIDSFSKPIVEDFSFVVDEGQQKTKVTKDVFILHEDSQLIKLAISYALSQSTELYSFEESALDIIKRNDYIVKELLSRGKVSLSQKDISKERGRIFKEISQIYLSYGFLDVPEFFWEYPELEPIYQTTANYLDIRPRIEVLNKKLAIIQDLLNMLADEQKHNHSAFLEMVIIILIAIDIIISLIKW